MSREEIIAAVKDCATRLGHAPNVAEFRAFTKITKNQIRKSFGTYTQMMAASAVQRQGSGCRVELKSLFMDWAGTVRKLGKVPTMSDYELEGRYSVRPLIRRFRTWSQVPAGLQEYARQEGPEGEWKDVMEIIANHLQEETKQARTFESPTIMPSRPRIQKNQTFYGKPMHAPLNCAPTNENGVIFAFGSVAKELGFSINHIQIACPDCEGLREVAPNRWIPVRIEFEYESRNFLTHMHSVDDCDLIVCWTHNWPDCPLEVLELKSVVEGGLKSAADLRR
jgi:Homing endonuclease associated repeat